MYQKQGNLPESTAHFEEALKIEENKERSIEILKHLIKNTEKSSEPLKTQQYMDLLLEPFLPLSKELLEFEKQSREAKSSSPFQKSQNLNRFIFDIFYMAAQFYSKPHQQQDLLKAFQYYQTSTEILKILDSKDTLLLHITTLTAERAKAAQ